LLVDDEQLFLNSLVPILAHYNFECATVDSGSAALQLLQARSFDLALLDVDLPDMSGCEIAAYIKSNCPATTSVMLTGRNTVETAVEAMRRGAYDFLAKPLRHEQLLKTIDKALEHNRLERELRGSEQRFRTLSEAAWEAIIIQEDGRVIEANSRFFEMFGQSPEKVRAGLLLAQLIAPSCYSETLSMLAEMDKEGVCAATALRVDGQEFPVEIKSRRIGYFGRSCMVWAIRDLSAQEAAEKEKIELQKKLASANKLKALGLMAGSVAHDLNNILSGIVSYPDLLLLQMDKNDRSYGHIKKIQDAGRRAAAVVSDLVAIARGNCQVKAVANINDIVEGYLDSLEHRDRLCNFSGVTVTTELAAGVQNICCAEQHLHKLLLNLIGNAMEAVGEQGKVCVRTENCQFVHPLQYNCWDGGGKDGDYIKLTVADDGPGIPEEHLEHIFDPFYSTKVMGKSGTGLGLTIVWKIVQDHNGWIEVKNGSRGAVFEIYLPATREEVCLSDRWMQASLQRGRGERVLIVDDQLEQAEVLEQALGSLGYKTHTVTSGEAAVAFIRDNAVDLILLDMIIGEGMNGRQTYEQILDLCPTQKAIIVSGYAQKDEMERVRELGVSCFLQKPVTLDRVSSVVRHVLEN